MKRILFLLLLFALTACTGAPDNQPAQPGTPHPTATIAAKLFAPLPTVTPTPTAIVPSATPTQDPITKLSFERDKALGRGINLGNALEAPNEGDWGITLQADYFKVISAAGFNTVRVPINWSGHADTKAPYTIDPVFFQRIDWVVQQAEQNHLNAIIDIHHYDTFMTNVLGEKARFIALWQQIAEHYKNAPDTVYFELLNEPDNNVDPTQWNSVLADAIQVIRKTNPNRTLIVGPVWWNSVDHLQELSLPANERNLIVTFHFYDPMQFTHQGAEFLQGADQWLGTTWTATTDQKNALTGQFYTAKQWSIDNNRPIFLGEFGVYHFADAASRALWISSVAREAESRGFSWAYWDFASGFGLYDLKTNQWLNALLSGLMTQP